MEQWRTSSERPSRAKGCIVLALLAAAVMLFPLLWPPVLNALHGSRVYRGIVVDARTGGPIPDTRVTGRWFLCGEFSPSFDGLFVARTGYTEVVADHRGQFSIRLRGHARTLHVKGALYEPKEVRLWEETPGAQLVVELEPIE